MKKAVNFLKRGQYFLLWLQLTVFGMFFNTCPVLAAQKTETITAEDISAKFEKAVGWIQGILLILAVIVGVLAVPLAGTLYSWFA